MTFGKMGARRTMFRRTPYWGLCFTAEADGSSVSMRKAGTPPDVTLLYSYDNLDWAPFVVGETVVPLPRAGDSVWLKAGPGGNSAFATSSSDYNFFVMSAVVAASGDVMSLVNGDVAVKSFNATIGVFRYLFRDCSALTSAPSLEAQAYASCYYGMFRGCTSLTSAPELKSDKLYTSCYREMFYGCTALVDVPDLKASQLAGYCYYNMFNNCSSLEVAPAVETETPSGNRCFGSMFYGCSSLRQVKVAFKSWLLGTDDLLLTSNWLAGVAASGVFKCPEDLGTPPDGENPISRGSSYCPNGWGVNNDDFKEGAL